MAENRKLSVNELDLGMYVAELDRSWLDTPFLFQGFYIRSDEDIEQLQAHCQFVYVSDDKQAPAANSSNALPKPAQRKPRSQVTKSRSLWQRLGFGFAGGKRRKRRRDSEDRYATTQSIREEIPQAVGIHQKAVVTVQSVMQDLRNKGSVDMTQLEATVTPMVDSVLRNPAALACLARMRSKDDYLYNHSLASSVWAAILGRQIGLDREDLDVLALGAMLLDVGKTRIPDEILAKPDALEADERALMHQHVDFGLDILKASGSVDRRVLDMVAHHHERHDGSGYPQGLSSDAIPVFGRIAGIVDTYDAMISTRPYAEPLSSYDALRKLRELAGAEFQTEIVDQFTRAIGAFPTGTLVELNSGDVAIVTKQGRIRGLRPEVMVIMDADKVLLESFRVVDLGEQDAGIAGKYETWIERGLPAGAFGIDPAEFYLN